MTLQLLEKRREKCEEGGEQSGALRNGCELLPLIPAALGWGQGWEMKNQGGRGRNFSVPSAPHHPKP